MKGIWKIVATILMRSVMFAIIVVPATGHASSLRPALDAALELSAEIQTLEARKDEQFERRKATGALMPSGPSATLFHRNDGPFSGLGNREYEGELAFPLWLPGERGAMLGSAETAVIRLEAEIASKRLEIARRVRDAYWKVTEQRERLKLAEQRRGLSKALADDLRRQLSAGQSAPLDLSLAEADLQDIDGTLAMRKSELQQALIQFRVLTGQVPPATFKEQESKLVFPAWHPRLIFRRAAVNKAEAELTVAQTVDRDRPELGVGVRTTRSDSTQPFDTNLGLRVKIPFAYEAINAPKRAAASAEVRGTEAELAIAEREVKGDLDQARAKLDGSRKQFAAVARRHDQLLAASNLVQASQRAGQTPLPELLRIRNQVFEAANARALAHVAVEQARSDVNQALGLEP